MKYYPGVFAHYDKLICTLVLIPTAQRPLEEAPPDPGQHGRRGHREDAGAEEDLHQDQLRRPEGSQHQARRQPGPSGRDPEE